MALNLQVIRIILGTFRNILEKIDDRDLEREAALQMVQFKTLKTLELMDSKKFDDDELNDDVEFLSEKLHSSVQDFSSFDEYVSEVCFKWKRKCSAILLLSRHCFIIPGKFC